MTDTLQDLIRISVGIEHIDDIQADFEQAFKAASIDPSKAKPENADKKGDTTAPVKTEV